VFNKFKDDILRLLKEDEEFRYAVVGLLGLQRLEEAVIELKNFVARLADIQAKQEERLTKVEERLTKVEDRLVKVEERLEKHDRKFNEIITELRELRRMSNSHDKILKEVKAYMHG
jgi:predicted  nucleic acid-binding Zn-ribbon protein